MHASDDFLVSPAAFVGFAEHLTQPFFVKNSGLEFTHVNAAFCRWLEVLREDVLGRTECAVFGAVALQNEAHDRAILDGGSIQLHVQRFGDRPRGESADYSVLKAPIRLPGGSLGLACLVEGDAGRTALDPADPTLYTAEDAAALKAAQGELLRRERLMVLGQLAAGLAHQIRNPLAAIANAIAIARRQSGEASPRAQEALRIANDEIWEANRIIGDLLDFARIRPPSPTQSDLADLVATAIESDPLPKDITLALDLPPISVFVDERQVRDALRNLLRNAREAMSDAGTIYIAARTNGAFAELSIQDTGEGVAQEYRHLLFEPLVTSKPLGIGLGLPTARALVSNQGGSLECGESKFSGACFVMRLPLTSSTRDFQHADR